MFNIRTAMDVHKSGLTWMYMRVECHGRTWEWYAMDVHESGLPLTFIWMDCHGRTLEWTPIRTFEWTAIDVLWSGLPWTFILGDCHRSSFVWTVMDVHWGGLPSMYMRVHQGVQPVCTKQKSFRILYTLNLSACTGYCIHIFLRGYYEDSFFQLSR